MRFLLAAVLTGCAWAQAPDIEQIMSRVGINQARSLEERQNWVYTQKQLLRMVRGNGRMAREEHREYDGHPEAGGVEKKLVKFDGKYESKGKDHATTGPATNTRARISTARFSIGMSNDMTDDHASRDGSITDLFPLTYPEQLKYNFKLMGTRGIPRHAGVSASPSSPSRTWISTMPCWKGEALIDAAEYQPVIVTTKMALRTAAGGEDPAGDQFKGLGFSVTYQKFADGLWFPVSYGGEFDVRAVFFYKRTISVSMVNTRFPSHRREQQRGVRDGREVIGLQSEERTGM